MKLDELGLQSFERSNLRQLERVIEPNIKRIERIKVRQQKHQERADELIAKLQEQIDSIEEANAGFNVTINELKSLGESRLLELEEPTPENIEEVDPESDDFGTVEEAKEEDSDEETNDPTGFNWGEPDTAEEDNEEIPY